MSRERSDINSTLLLLQASQGGGREKEGRKEGGTEGGSKPKVGTFLDAGNPSTRRKATNKQRDRRPTGVVLVHGRRGFKMCMWVAAGFCGS